MAAISVTLNGNALTGNYNKAVAGSETTPYSEAAIQSTELAGFKAFIEAYGAQTDRVSSTSASSTSGYPSITYDMNVDVVTIDAGTTTNTLSAALDADTAAEAGLDAVADTADDTTDSAGGVTTKNELDIVSAP